MARPKKQPEVANEEVKTDEVNQVDEIAAQLGTPDLDQFLEETEEESPEITERIMGESDVKAQALGAGEMVALFAVLGTNIMAKVKGQHWKLANDEVKELKTAADAALPEKELSPTWALVAVGFMIAAPRLMVDFDVIDGEVLAKGIKEHDEETPEH